MTGKLFFRLIAFADADDHSVIDEQIGDIVSDIKQAARIETQIEDEALDAGLLQILHNPVHIAVAVPRELGQPDVGDLVLGVDHVVPAIVGLASEAENRLDIDVAARQVEVDRLGHAFALHGQTDFGAGLAGDLLDGLVELHPLGREDLRRIERLTLAIDLTGDGGNKVAGLDASFVGRTVFNRRDNEKLIGGGILADLDADPREATADLALHPLFFLAIDVRRVRIGML